MAGGIVYRKWLLIFRGWKVSRIGLRGGQEREEREEMGKERSITPRHSHNP